MPRTVEMLAQTALQCAHVELFDASAALPVNGLYHEHGVLFDKGGKLRVARGGVVKPVAVQKVRKIVRESELVFDLRHIRRIVIGLYEAVVHAAR